MNNDNDFGIIDLKRNPFVPKRRHPEVKGWIEDRRPLTEHRKDQLVKLWNLNIESIKSYTEFDATYVAFTAIRWGFAETSDEKKLTATNIWCDKDIYDDRGILKSIEPEAISNPVNNGKPKAPSKEPITLPNPMQRDDLIRELRMFQVEPIIKKYLAKNHLPGKTAREVLAFSFDRTIKRRFQNEDPTERYKKWRWYRNPNELWEKLDILRSQEDFDQFLISLGNSLVTDWGKLNNHGEPSRMNIGIALKINNLILKHLIFSKCSNCSNLKEWLHVPWDKFTLNPLRIIYQGYPAIPKNPSQGFVKNIDTYQKLHTLISNITQEAGVDRIIFEFWAWDFAHIINSKH